MLRELPDTPQIAGEPRRRWFFCHELDLVVWFDEAGEPCGFQLAYDKYRGEHSISWKAGTGYRHFLVDDGEGSALNSETPLLYADGPFHPDRVLDRLIALAGDLPDDIVHFVVDKLREFQG